MKPTQEVGFIMQSLSINPGGERRAYPPESLWTFLRFSALASVGLFLAISPMFAQEYEDSRIPAYLKADAPKPEHKLYGSALRQFAAFERAAAENEKKGADGGAFRRHLLRKFDVSEGERQVIAVLAQDYTAEETKLRMRAVEVGQQFRERYFANNQHMPGTPFPPPDERLVAISKQLRDLTLSCRDRVQGVFGRGRLQAF